MAEAYAYAEDPSQNASPAEIGIARAIDRFGVKAVTGKDVLRPGLIYRITVVESILAAFESRKNSCNWASWGNENPELADMLVKAHQYGK